MNDKPTIENLESWFDTNANKRRSYSQKRALEFCGLLIAAMHEIEAIKHPSYENSNASTK